MSQRCRIIQNTSTQVRTAPPGAGCTQTPTLTGSTSPSTPGGGMSAKVTPMRTLPLSRGPRAGTRAESGGPLEDDGPAPLPLPLAPAPEPLPDAPPMLRLALGGAELEGPAPWSCPRAFAVDAGGTAGDGAAAVCGLAAAALAAARWATCAAQSSAVSAAAPVACLVATCVVVVALEFLRAFLSCCSPFAWVSNCRSEEGHGTDEWALAHWGMRCALATVQLQGIVKKAGVDTARWANLMWCALVQVCTAAEHYDGRSSRALAPGPWPCDTTGTVRQSLRTPAFRRFISSFSAVLRSTTSCPSRRRRRAALVRRLSAGVAPSKTNTGRTRWNNSLQMRQM